MTTQSHARSIRFVWLALIIALISALAPTQARASTLYQDMMNARAEAERAHQDYLKVKLTPEQMAKIDQFMGKIGWLNDDPSYLDMQAMLNETFTREEIAALQPFIQAKQAELRAANKAAEAERLYFEEFKKKDQALDAARAQFDADRIHIRSERDELLKLGKGTREFNERAQQLIDRLREHYQKMEADLEPYRDYPDVRAFLDDINHRQARLKGFEISLINPVDEVATTPGDGGTTPGDTSTVPPVVVPPADPKDPTAIDEKRGEAWVLSGAPVVKIETATRGVVVSSGPTGASWEITGDDGTKGIAGIKIDKAPPPVLYRGEEQTYLLSAFGQAPAAAVGIWKPTNFGGLPFDDNTAVAASFPGFRGGADFTIGRWHAHFIAVDDPEHSAPVTIVAELFRPLPNAERDPYVTITWTYVKSGAKNAPATP